MYRFGTAGNPKSFYDAGLKSSVQAPGFLSARGLNAYEYSAGRGVQIGEDTARAIGAEARRQGVYVSIHAPYYINCATLDPESREKSFGYILDSARAIDWMGGERVIFHPGSEKGGRDAAMERACVFLTEVLERMDDAGLGHIHLCPETMGKVNMLGTLDDVIRFCALDQRMIPTLDFAHLHARGQGCLNTVYDFEAVIVRLMDGLWPDRAGDMPERLKHFHVHFSHVQYTSKGERKHVSFADEGYGPDFCQLAVVLKKYSLEPVVICESRETQAEDAAAMRDIMREAIAQSGDIQSLA